MSYSSESEQNIICKCKKVSEHEIRFTIERHGAKSLQEIRDITTANTGCGGCIKKVEGLLAEYAKLYI